MIYYVSDIVEEYLKLGKFERPFEPIPNTMNWLPDDEDMIPKGQQSLNGFEKKGIGFTKIPAYMEWSGEDRKKIESFYPSTYGETISSLTREIFPNPQEAEIESARRLEKLRTYLKTLDDKQSEDKNQKFAKYGRLAQYFFLPQINDEYKHLKKQQKQLGVPEK